MPPTRLKKLRLKKKRQKAKAADAAGKQARARTANRDSSASQVAAQALAKKPTEMTSAEISSAISEIETQIEKGKALLPTDASLLQRALFALKLALLELGGVDPELAVKDKEQLEALIAANTSDSAPDAATKVNMTNAIADVNQAQAAIASRNPASQNAVDAAYPGLALLKQKQPEELSAQELTDAIDDIDRSIQASKVLLPADASLQQQVLYTLKMVLLELGGVDPRLRYNLKDELEALITANHGDSALDAATKVNVTSAIADVNQAQAEIASRNPASQNAGDSAYPGLDLLKQKKVADLSTVEVRAALDDIDRTIAESKVLLPANISLLQRALYALKMVLLDLDNVTPKVHYEIQTQLETILAERTTVDS